MNQKVTIVIPVYNQERFIKNAVECALRQTYPNCSVLVIDDGSTDKTSQILQEYGNRIQVICQKNSGTSIAWNKAIENTTDNFLIGLDSDDEFINKTVAEIVLALEKNPDADIVYSDYEVIGSEGKVKKLVKNPEPIDPIGQLIHLHDRLGQPNNFLPFGHVRLYKRQKLIDIGGYDPQYSYAEDYDLTLRLAEQGAKFIHVPQNLYRYRWHDKNKGVVTRKEQIEDVRRSLAAFYARNPNYKKKKYD